MSFRTAHVAGWGAGLLVWTSVAQDVSPAHHGFTQTTGGRGGEVLRVTTLAASGPGSLAQALGTKGRRLVVFEVGGVIDLRGRSLTIHEPWVTVAGQTSPGHGITLIRGGIVVSTHDVILQHLRVRPGEAGHTKRSGWEVDGITTAGGAHDVIVDHCSLTWATDENLSASGPRFDGPTPAAWRKATSHRITFSNCILAEGLSRSTHALGEHSKGSLIHDNTSEIAILGNLYANNMQRNPLFKAGARGVVVNNLIVNPGNQAVYFNLVPSEWAGHPWETAQMAVTGNVVIAGLDTSDRLALLALSPGPLELHMADNRAVNRHGDPLPLLRNPPVSTGTNGLRLLKEPPLWPPRLKPVPLDQVREAVLAHAGARPWDRDAIDRRIIEQARTGTGRIIHSEQEVGGYPQVKPVRASFNPSEWDLETMERHPRPQTTSQPGR